MDKSAQDNLEEDRKKKIREIEQARVDEQIVLQVVKALTEISKLSGSLSRLKEIALDEKHALFVSSHTDLTPEMREFLSKMRRAQVGGLVHMMSIIKKTQFLAEKEIPKMDLHARKSAVDKAMQALGIEADETK